MVEDIEQYQSITSFENKENRCRETQPSTQRERRAYGKKSKKGSNWLSSRHSSEKEPFAANQLKKSKNVGTLKECILIENPGKLTPKLKFATKKRGVCASPVLELKSYSLEKYDSFPPEQDKRSRSRLFSPKTTYNKIKEDSKRNLKKSMNSKEVNIERQRMSKSFGNGIYDTLFDCEEIISSSYGSDESETSKNVFELQCSWQMNNENNSSFHSESSSSRNSTKEVDNCSANQPSLEDQEYLVKYLYEQNQSTPESRLFGSTIIVIATPVDWTDKRKATFLHWGKSIGFSVKASNANETCFLETSIDNGKRIFNDLFPKIRTKKINKPIDDGENYRNQECSAAIDESVDDSVPCSFIAIDNEEENKVDRSNVTIDSELIQNLQNMKIIDFANENKIEEHDEGGTGSYFSPPFLSPKESVFQKGSKSISKPPRVSGEQLCRQDFALQLNGIFSPSIDKPLKPMKLLQLSTEKTFEPHDTTFDPEGKTSLNDISFSSVTLDKTTGVIANNVEITPFTDKLECEEQFDFTPMVKQCFESDKDWGVSEPCSPEVIFVLTKRLEDAYLEANPMHQGDLPALPCLDTLSEVSAL